MSIRLMSSWKSSSQVSTQAHVANQAPAFQLLRTVSSLLRLPR